MFFELYRRKVGTILLVATVLSTAVVFFCFAYALSVKFTEAQRLAKFETYISEIGNLKAQLGKIENAVKNEQFVVRQIKTQFIKGQGDVT